MSPLLVQEMGSVMHHIAKRTFILGGLSAAASALAGCAGGIEISGLTDRPSAKAALSGLSGRVIARPNYAEAYRAFAGEEFPVDAFDYKQVDPSFLRQTVAYSGNEAPGSIVVDPQARHLFFVDKPGVATRYGVGVGREGFAWNGAAKINMRRAWPDWIPPHEMVERDPQIRARLVETPRGLGVAGGPQSPLGARAMYLFDNTGDTGYRLHGTTEPETIGTAVSSGCVRLVNQDIIHIFARAKDGTPVTVLG